MICDTCTHTHAIYLSLPPTLSRSLSHTRSLTRTDTLSLTRTDTFSLSHTHTLSHAHTLSLSLSLRPPKQRLQRRLWQLEKRQVAVTDATHRIRLLDSGTYERTVRLDLYDGDINC